jgi:hypothetical protein
MACGGLLQVVMSMCRFLSCVWRMSMTLMASSCRVTCCHARCGWDNDKNCCMFLRAYPACTMLLGAELDDLQLWLNA